MPCRNPSSALCLSALFSLALVFTARYAPGQTVSTSDGLSLTLTSDAQVSAVIISGDNLVQTPSAALRLRDLSSAGLVFSPNMLANPGFENDSNLDGIPDNWSVFLVQDATIAITSSDQAEGSQSVIIDTLPGLDGGAALASSPVTVAAGTRYRLSAQMKARDGYLTYGGTSIVWQKELYESPTQVSGIHIQWLDAGGQPLGGPAVVAPMHMNASQWKRITGEVVAPPGAASARVIVGANLADALQEGEALWVDDVSMTVTTELDSDVTGTVSLVGSDLLLTGTVAGAGLDVEATYRAFPDHLEVSGQVVDTTASERAFDLTVRLPVSLSGYTWWDDLRTSRIVTPGTDYSNSISGDVGGLLPISFYPLAAMEDAAHGLSLALPMDTPQVALLQYANGAFEARFKLGISPAATRLGGAASFKLYITRFEPDWGFRAALAKLESIAPQWFNSTRDGYAFSGFEQGDYSLPTKALEALHHDEEGIASGEYTAPEGPLAVADLTDPPPGYDAIVQFILNNQSDPRITALANSMVLDGNGDFFLKLLAIPNWDPNHWVSVWVLDMDPELPGGYATWIRDYKVDPAFATTSQYGAQLDAIEFDNFMSAPAIDLDPTHLALADFPLTYDPNTYRPGLHTQAAAYEFLSWLTSYVAANYGSYPGFSANVWGIGTVNSLAPFLDGLGNEGNPGRDGNWTYDILNYRRVLAYHKPVRFTNQEPNVSVADANRFASRVLFYGMHGRPGAHGVGWEPGAEEIVNQANLWLARYWQLGWEPVTHATSGKADVWVERFGSDPDGGLYFTVYNSGTGTQSYTLTVDTGALGIPSPPVLVVKELRSGATLSYTTGGSNLQITGGLGPEDTDIIRLMGTGCSPLSLGKAAISLREGTSNDKATLKGDLIPPPTPPDFLNDPVGITLSDRDGEIYSATIPPGSFVANPSGTRFKFKDSGGTIANSLTYASFKRKGDGSYKWKMKIKNADLAGINWQYIDSRLTIGTGCMVDSTGCSLRANGKRLDCRPPRLQ